MDFANSTVNGETRLKRKLEIKASSIFEDKNLTPEQKKKKQQQIELLTKKKHLLVGTSATRTNPALKKPSPFISYVKSASM